MAENSYSIRFLLYNYLLRMEAETFSPSQPLIKNSINRYLNQVSSAVLFGGAVLTLAGKGEEAEAWLFRDDIGAPNGIKGYEEQVNSVGGHHGHSHWPSDITWNTYNSATYVKHLFPVIFVV